MGLRLETTKSDIARAVIEGLAFSVGHIATVVAECGVCIDEVFLAGGLARNDLLCQIKADVWNVPVKTFRDHELTSIGLGVIMAVSMGYFKDIPEATQSFTKVEKEFTPQIVKKSIWGLSKDIKNTQRHWRQFTLLNIYIY